MAISISWRSISIYDSKDTIKKCTIPGLLVLIMTSQISKLMKWLKIIQIEYLKNETAVPH